MKVAVLGAGGTIAPAIVRDLAGSPEVGELLLLDLDRERARVVAEVHGSGKARAESVDARRHGALEAALHGADVLVNSASYRINLEAMRASLAARCHYLDLGGLYWMTGRQLALGPEFQQADRVAVLGIGSAPGKTNLMAAKAMATLCGDGSPDRVLSSCHVAAAGRDLTPPAGESFPYALQTLLDEVTMPPIAVSGGEPTELEPLADGGRIDFGEPIGSGSSIYTVHSEMLTFPSSFGCSEASFRLSLSAAVEARLRELAAADPTEVAAPGGGHRATLGPDVLGPHRRCDRRRPLAADPLGHAAPRGVASGRRHRLHRDPDRGGRQDARPGADHRARRAAARALHRS